MNLAYNLKQSLIEKTEAALTDFSLINEVEVYSYTATNGKLVGFCTIGKSTKPLWHSYFENKEKLKKFALETIESYQKRKKIKEEYKNEKRKGVLAAVANIKAGNIFVYSYGYECTLIEFWQIIDKCGQNVKIRKVSRKLHCSERGGSNYYLPLINVFIDEEIITKKLQAFSINNYYIKFSCGIAHLHDGKPKYETDIMWR